MTDADRAREIVEEIAKRLTNSLHPSVKDLMVDRITQALTAVREEARREERDVIASRVHDLHLEMHVADHGECIVCSLMTKIAAAIRGQEG